VAGLLLGYAVALSHEEPGTPQTRDLLERAVAILRAAPGDVREDLAQALLTSSYGREPDFSLPRMREALVLLRDVHGERHTAVAAALSDLALATEPVDILAADSLMEQSLEILISIHGRRHHTLLTAMSNLAALRRDRGAFAEAEPLYREVLALSRDLYPEQRMGQAYALYGLGRVLVETGQVDEGDMRLREALAILEVEGPPPLVALTKVAIGQALTLRARFADAERILLPACEDVLNSPVSPIDKALALQRVVELYRRWDRQERRDVFQQRLDSLINADRLQDAFPGKT
jgi:tetratricopeptide (TPR) repeat protein